MSMNRQGSGCVMARPHEKQHQPAVTACTTIDVIRFYVLSIQTAIYENHLLSAMSWLIFLADSGKAAIAWRGRKGSG
jgi:hypothetical protein